MKGEMESSQDPEKEPPAEGRAEAVSGQEAHERDGRGTLGLKA